MNRLVVFCLGFQVCAGCVPSVSNHHPSNVTDGQPKQDFSAPFESVARYSTPRVTNRFGMTLCLVSVDEGLKPGISTHTGLRFPGRSFYLQQSELTFKQFSKCVDFLRQTDKTKAHLKPHDFHFPTEWRQVYEFSQTLSSCDPDYEYRLPTREEWSFACMNGHDEDCPGPGASTTAQQIDNRRPNKFGIEGLLNYDAECGDLPGLCLGKRDYWAENQDCRCKQFVFGNPDADDGLNELISARFVLVPRSESRQE
jgi:hypothetical protein